MRIRATIASALTLILAVGLLQFTTPPQKAEAVAVASQFNPGMIISDALFYDGGAMTSNAVQNFLNSQVRSCAAGATCLKDFRQTTVSRPAVEGRCAAYAGAANESAADIITKVGAACGISQKALIVLLQKEQGLVTATAPSAGKYQIATGYACPDTAACDAQYFGFFNQVYSAASQFKRYSTLPSAFNHVAGRVNNVRLHPNAACGSTPVLIQNKATAGLYNYTPYQPNASAMANLYGTGDACASYGNRNFWRYFTDWFGSTTVTSLMRTPENPLVYVVAGTTKYPITTYAMYNAYSALGTASFVSQSYLDTLSTAHEATRIIRAPDGAIYFIDSGIKTQFDSCVMVNNYGGSCGDTGYINLTDAQVASFYTGPTATAVLGTREGARYYLENGIKREILDDASQAAAGLPFGQNILTEAAVETMPFGSPIIRGDTFVANSRQTGETYLVSAGKRYDMSAATATSSDLVNRAGALHHSSLAQIPVGPSRFDGSAVSEGSNEVVLLSKAGRYSVTLPAIAAAFRPVPMSSGFLAGYQSAGSVSEGLFVKSASADAVTYVTPTGLRWVTSWAALTALAGGRDATILTLDAGVFTAMPKGPTALGPGMMYRTPDAAGIFLIDGLSNRVPISSFEYPHAAGFTGWSYASQAELDAYAVTPGDFTYGVACGTAKFVAAGGSLHAVAAGQEGLFPFAWTPLAPETCSRTATGAPANEFIRTADGSIYQLAEGTKRYISADRLAAVTAGRTWLQVPNGFAAALPNGPAA